MTLFDAAAFVLPNSITYRASAAAADSAGMLVRASADQDPLAGNQDHCEPCELRRTFSTPSRYVLEQIVPQILNLRRGQLQREQRQILSGGSAVADL
jgi:hypothetical protein